MLIYFAKTSFILLITAHFSYAAVEFPEKIIFDRNDFYLKGKVKKIQTWLHYPHDTINLKNDPKAFYFNEKGILYRYDSEFGHTAGNWFFDAKTKLLKTHEIYFLSKNGTKSNRQLGNVLRSTIDGKPSSIGYIEYGPNNTTGYSYRKRLVKIEYESTRQTIYDYFIEGDGKLILNSKINSSFFPNSTLVQQEQIPSPFNNKFGIIRNYNKNGLDSILTTTDDIQIKKKFIYDKNLLIKEITEDLKSQSVKSEIEYSQYQLDECGNWIERKIKSIPDDRIAIQYRVFEYFSPCTR